MKLNYLAGIIFFALVGCSDSDKLVGEWDCYGEYADAKASMTYASTLSFSDDNTYEETTQMDISGQMAGMRVDAKMISSMSGDWDFSSENLLYLGLDTFSLDDFDVSGTQQLSRAEKEMIESIITEQLQKKLGKSRRLNITEFDEGEMTFTSNRVKDILCTKQ